MGNDTALGQAIESRSLGHYYYLTASTLVDLDVPSLEEALELGLITQAEYEAFSEKL